MCYSVSTGIFNLWMTCSVRNKLLGSLTYGDYGLRLRINMLLRIIKTTGLIIFPA